MSIDTTKAAKLTDAMKAALKKLARDGYSFAGVSTFKALERRGLVTANTAPRDPAKGVWCHYMLTDAGREVAAQEAAEGAACGNRWKYGKDVCVREAGHGALHRNTEALEAWTFQWFDNEGTPAEQPVENEEPTMPTYGEHRTEALENGFPELLAHKVAEIRTRRAKPTAEARTFTVIYTGMGEPIVHAAGCSHNVHDSLRGAHTTEDITGTLEEVGRAVYSDMLEEGSMSPEDCIPNLRIKPCAR